MKHVPEDWGYCDECEGQREHELHKRLAALQNSLNWILVRNQDSRVSDADAMSEIHELFYEHFQRECRDAWHMHHGERTSCGSCGATA